MTSSAATAMALVAGSAAASLFWVLELWREHRAADGTIRRLRDEVRLLRASLPAHRRIAPDVLAMTQAIEDLVGQETADEDPDGPEGYGV